MHTTSDLQEIVPPEQSKKVEVQPSQPIIRTASQPKKRGLLGRLARAVFTEN